jgi:hypothetical protein
MITMNATLAFAPIMYDNVLSQTLIFPYFVPIYQRMVLVNVR